MSFISTHKVTIVALLVVVGLVGYFTYQTISDRASGPGSELSNIQNVNEGDGLPYTDLDQNPVDLNQYAGKPLVINAWATWCPFCVNELPDFSELKSEFGDQIEVIAINRMESAVTARAFIDHVNNPDGLVFLLDSKDTFYKSIGGFAMPETVFYDSEGNIAVHKRGFMTLEEMRTHTNTTLRGPQ